MVSVHHDVIDLIFGNSIWTLRRSLSLGPFNIGAIPIDKLDIEVRNPVRYTRHFQKTTCLETSLPRDSTAVGCGGMWNRELWYPTFSSDFT